MSYPVSICIIAKNEEKYIEECLKRIMPYDMEIVVVDTGSTDRTKKIALKYTDKVYDFTWINDFSAARNFCAQKAKNNWILAIDCDEYLESLDTKQLRMYMQKFPKLPGKITIQNIAKRNDGTLGYVDEQILRFYNRNHYTFNYPIHENITYKNNSSVQTDCFLAPIRVIHHGYNIPADEMKQKQLRNLALLYQSLETQSDRTAYIHFQIGQSEQVLGNMEVAISHYQKCLDSQADIHLPYMNSCLIQLANAYAQNDQPQDALYLLEQYKDTLKNARFIYTYALALLENGETLKALMQFVLITTLKDKELLGEDLMYCYQYIIKLYSLYGEEDLAEGFHQKYIELSSVRDKVLNQAKTQH